ncbi:MAG: radical SAM protein [Candidatus Pacearchaeota archaeon]|jgi:radical SAM superfamily enzyme YgiQ (UPF0313 family)
MNNPKITLVELPPTSFGKLNTPLVKDIYTRFRLPARANPLLHAILYNEGYEDVKSIDPRADKRNEIDGKDLERIISSDYLLLSSITRTINQTEQLAKLYRLANRTGKIIVGGFHASLSPLEVLEWADVVVRHEGDKTIVELLRNLNNGLSLENVKGISYRIGNEFINNPCREFLTEKELSNLPNPDYSIYPRRTMGVLNTSRGCPYGCNFCSVTEFYGRNYRRKSNSKILEELAAMEKTKKIFSNRSIFITDDNFAMKKEETKELLKEMAKLNNGRKYTCQLSVNSAFVNGEDNIDEEFLYLLKKANFIAVCLGVESINEDTLKSYKKPATAERNKIAVTEFRKAGLWNHVMMVIGGDGDTNESLDETVEWARKYVDSVQFFAPIPFPGTSLTKEMEKQGRMLSKDYYLYDGFHVVIEPKNFSPYELQMKILEMDKKFYTLKNNPYIKDSARPWYKRGVHTYAQKMMWDIEHEPQSIEHIKMLKKME